MATRTVRITTSAGGAYTKTIPFHGVIKAIAIDIGDLSTPDIAITDSDNATNVLTMAGMADGGVFQPSKQLDDTDGTPLAGAFGPIAVMGTLSVVVAGGGNVKSGSVKFLF